MALFLIFCFLVLLNCKLILLHNVNNYYFGLKMLNRLDEANLVPSDKYPFVVLLNLTKKQTYCTGALISRTFVLTVAHCVNEETDKSVVVYRRNLNGKPIEQTINSVITFGYEERRSAAIIQPWFYKPSGNTIFDIALIQLEKNFEGRDFVKATLLTPFIKPNVVLTCKTIGYDVGAIYSLFHKRNANMLIEETLQVKKQCMETKTNGKCSGMSWIVQQDKTYIDNTFAKSGALLLCSGNNSLKNILNGISLGKIDVSSLGTSNTTEYPIVFKDICPFLSWVRSYVGPRVIRSPGHYGRGCFDSNASSTTHNKAKISWFITTVCIVLYLE